jgi:hypothetical protein
VRIASKRMKLRKSRRAHRFAPIGHAFSVTYGLSGESGSAGGGVGVVVVHAGANEHLHFDHTADWCEVASHLWLLRLAD